MTDQPTTAELCTTGAPFVRAAEGARTVFIVTALAACGPLLAGIFLFGWRAAMVAAVCVLSCAAIENMYYSVTKVPALLGRSHAYLTGVLLALTLPPFTPWYVAVVASAFAIIVGKGIFGGVGHFLWQPAIVGRLAVAVMFAGVLNPPNWPVLSQERLLVGDVTKAKAVENYYHWQDRPAPAGADAFLLQRPAQALSGLSDPDETQFASLASTDEEQGAHGPAALMALPAIDELMYGAYGGGIGETCAIAIVIAGLYLIYRSYVKWQLPVAFIASAAAVAALSPVYLLGAGGAGQAVSPLTGEGLDVGIIYVCYQLLGGGTLLAAFFLATEMTSRPVTGGGQLIFGVGCGVLAMFLQLYTPVPIPAYMAVLAMNTLTPAIDGLWRPRVFGRRRFAWLGRSSR